MAQWKDFVTALVKADIEFPHLKPVILAQSLAECGRLDTLLSQDSEGGHRNTWGMKWKPEVAHLGGKRYYKTDSEPSGGAEFVVFDSYDQDINAYFGRLDAISSYSGWRNHVNNADAYAEFVFRKWCPPGFEEDYIKEHDGKNYKEVVFDKHLPVAKAAIYAVEQELKVTQEIEWNRSDSGDVAITLYEDGVAKYTRFPKDRKHADEFLRAFPEASFVVPDTSKKVIPLVRDLGEKPPVKKRRVRLDPGHSEQRVGARGKAPDVQEEDLNRLQAECLKEELAALGIEAHIDDPLADDLFAIGKGAQDCDAFVSLHLNAYSKKEHYTCAMCHSSLQKPNSKSATVASKWAQSVAKAINNPCFDGTPGWPKGVMAAGLSVLNGASQTNCPVFFLSEMEFVDDEDTSTLSAVKERIRVAMKAGARVLAESI